MSKEAAALKGEVVGVTSVEVAFEGTIDFGNGDKLDLQEHGLATVTVTLDVIPNEAEQVKLDALT